MNLAILSGKLTNIQPMTQNVFLGRLEDEIGVYILLWESSLDVSENMIGKNITVVCNIAFAKIKIEGKARPKLTTCYKVKEMEIVDDI